MSRRGNCYDIAVVEGWFSTVKNEEGERFEDYAHPKKTLLDYIEVFFNTPCQLTGISTEPI